MRATLLATTIALLLALGGCATYSEAGPDKLKDTWSLNDVVRASGEQPLHIVFVHGMRAEGPGTSAALRAALCSYIEGGCIFDHSEHRPPLDLGPRPTDADVAGKPIWQNDAEWIASRPFVDRYVFRRPSGGAIVLDEVNWWPLLFPLKCRFLVAQEASLAGPDSQHLRRCSESAALFYPWISEASARLLERTKPIGGGGAKGNAWVKQQILDWGLADAVIALGPTRQYIRKALNASFADAAPLDGRSLSDQSVVVISESLGSFVVMDAFEDPGSDTAAIRAVLDQTLNLYFFANQYQLLELGRSHGIGLTSAPDEGPPGLRGWVESKRLLRQAFGANAHAPQIIAFSDPSDALTFDVPHVQGAKAVNLRVHNATRFFGLFENPKTAHTGHSGNATVLDLLFRGAPKED